MKGNFKFPQSNFFLSLFQEEIRFCINPELLVALMFMEVMQDNECIVVRVSFESNSLLSFFLHLYALVNIVRVLDT